MGTIDIR